MEPLYRPPGFRGAVVLLAPIWFAALSLGGGCGRSTGEKPLPRPESRPEARPGGFPELPAPAPGDEEAQTEARKWVARLGHSDFKVRVEATDALARIGLRAVRPLVLAMRSDESALRTNAAHVLKILAEREDTRERVRFLAVDTLIVSLRNPDLYSRTMAAQTLGAIGDQRAVPALIEMLEAPQSRVRACASEALKAMTGESFGQDSEAWKAWHEKNR